MKRLSPFNVKRFVVNEIAVADFELLHNYFVIKHSGNEPTPEYKQKIESEIESKGYTTSRFDEIIKVFDQARVATTSRISGGHCSGDVTIWAYVMDKIDSCSPSWK
ncbi:hypothetical protein QX249_09990 [Vibrio parahaemolyticus]|uniref:Uncharacterized protein n=1 Tax=Vibrio parahaemolyticus TaxID=670 RepID=A0AAW8PZD3_VIBPH|nr:hypothetical protein [Vibrio parahaemolyticus]EGR2229594.1 hypothetical protein [Vibrio parahaemolyticus]MDS1820988.1 hypothetical protein [Vibrio parahaemolyticus]